MPEPVFIRVNDLRRYYPMGSAEVHALDGISLDIQRGGMLGVTGPSGSGKSTFLYLLGGLDRPTSGELWVDGKNLSGLDEDGLANYRQHTVGFIFQMFNLIPTLSALENVEFPLLFTNVRPRQRRQLATELLERVGLAERMQHLPTELSGGQQQRVAIARALINSPQIILADEPTGNLDSHSGAEVLEVLQALNRQGITLVVVSHDPGVISAARQSIRLHDGQIVECRAEQGGV